MRWNVSAAEYRELAAWVKKRLDEVFPDDSEPSGAPQDLPGGSGPAAAGGGKRREAMPAGPLPKERIAAAPCADSAQGQPEGGVPAHEGDGRRRRRLESDPGASPALHLAPQPKRSTHATEPPRQQPGPGAAREVDLRELKARFKERLNAVFPDDAVPTDVSAEERHELFGAERPACDSAATAAGAARSSEPGREAKQAQALHRLRAVADGLLPEMLQPLADYARELERFQAAFEDERHLWVAIQLQSRLCRHMVSRFHRIHHDAVATLLKGFDAMQRLATDRRLSDEDRRRTVGRLLREFKQFSRSLPANDRRMPEPGVKTEEDGGRDAQLPKRHCGRPNPRAAEDEVREFRSLLRHEFALLEDLLLAHWCRRI
jgi:hypothetical protein